MDFLVTLLCFLLLFTFVILDLDNYKLSKNIYIKILQILSPILLFLLVFLIQYNITGTSNVLNTVMVTSTLPVIGENIQELVTSRLIIRPLLFSDLEAFRTLRSEAGAMNSSTRGRPDKDSETEDYLENLQSPFKDSRMYFGIFLKNPDGSEGELIGDGGIYKILNTDSGFPEYGYKFKQQF